MVHLRNRDDLLDLLARCPRKFVHRALDQDRVECLGLFSGVTPDDPHPAWMFKIGAKTVAAILRQHEVKFRILKCTPWDLWNGGLKGLAGGDRPALYSLRRAYARASYPDGGAKWMILNGEYYGKAIPRTEDGTGQCTPEPDKTKGRTKGTKAINRCVQM